MKKVLKPLRNALLANASFSFITSILILTLPNTIAQLMGLSDSFWLQNHKYIWSCFWYRNTKKKTKYRNYSFLFHLVFGFINFRIRRISNDYRFFDCSSYFLDALPVGEYLFIKKTKNKRVWYLKNRLKFHLMRQTMYNFFALQNLQDSLD